MTTTVTFTGAQNLTQVSSPASGDLVVVVRASTGSPATIPVTAFGAGITYGTTAGTAAQGNDARITGALSVTTAASTYLTTATAASTYALIGAGGTITYGTTAGTSAQGNDARIIGALSAASAASTYAPLASPVFTGSPTVPGYLTIASASSTYAPISGGLDIGTGNIATAHAGFAIHQFNVSDAPTDQKKSDIFFQQARIDFRLANDAYSASNNYLSVVRSGYTALNVTLAGNAISLTAPTVAISGNLSVSAGNAVIHAGNLGTNLSWDGTHLNATGGGSVTYGTTAGTAAQGNDARIVGALSAATASSTYAPLASPVAGNTIVTLQPTDYVLGYTLAGSAVFITYQNLLNSKTIDALDPAGAAGDTDVFATVQSGSVAKKQPLSGLWTYVAAKLPSAKRPKIELSANTTLDGSVHNGAVLVCTANLLLVLPSDFTILAAGASVFECVVVANGGIVSFGIGITATGSLTLASGQSAILRCFIRSDSTHVAIVQTPSSGTSQQIAVNAPTGVSPSTAYAVSATFAGYLAAPTLTYSVDAGAFIALPGGSTVTSSGANFTAPGVVAGAHTIQLKDGNGLLSNSAAFAAATGPAITVNALSAQPFVASGGTTSSVPVSVTLSNYSSAPTLTYSLDGAAYASLPAGNSVSTSAASFTLAAVAGGSHTLIVKDASAVTSNTLSFTDEAVNLASVPTSGWISGSASTLTGATTTLSGLTTAYAVLWSGTAEEGARQAFTSSATLAALSVTPTTANATHTVRAYDAASGGNLLAETATFTVGSAGAFTLSGSTLTGNAGGYHWIITNWPSSVLNSTSYTIGVSSASLVNGTPFTGANGIVRTSLSTGADGSGDTSGAGYYGNPSSSASVSVTFGTGDLRYIGGTGTPVYLRFRTDDPVVIIIPYPLLKG